MSVDGILSEPEGTDVYYLKETVSLSREGPIEFIYKFFFSLQKFSKISIYLPFRFEENIEWLQKRLTEEDYVKEVVEAEGFRELGEDLFSYKFDKDIDWFDACVPKEEILKKHAKTVREESGGKDWKRTRISIDTSSILHEKSYSEEKPVGIALLFKGFTSEFLKNDIAEQAKTPGQIWDFNLFLYTDRTSLTLKEVKKRIPISHANVWIVFPENTKILHLHPSPAKVIRMEPGDENAAEPYYDKNYKTFVTGQIAACWEFKEIRGEESIHCFLENPEKSQIENIHQKIEEEFQKMDSRFKERLRETQDMLKEEIKGEIKKKYEQLRYELLVYINNVLREKSERR